MNPSNASSCLHFTAKIDTLKSILTNGLRYSYAFEEFPPSILENVINDYEHKGYHMSIARGNGIAIPMISFCDIPITRAEEHAKYYGKYILGIDKSFLINTCRESFFNPVIYVCGEHMQEAIAFFTSERLKTMNRLIEDSKSIVDNQVLMSKISATNDPLSMIPENCKKEVLQRMDETFYSLILLSLYKPINGKDSKGENRDFYNEREWRLFIPHTPEEPYQWSYNISRSEFLNTRDELNDQMSLCEDMFITIPIDEWNNISHIVVESEDHVDMIIDFIMNATKLFGYEVAKDERAKLKLISKISSFEKIEKDY